MKAGRRGRCGQLLVVIVVGMVALVSAGQARAAFPGRNGQISFATDRAVMGSFQIARVNPNGSDIDQVTHTSAKHNSVFSDWSPSGREIAFDSDRTGTVQVYTVHADGRDVDQLTHLKGFTAQPSWSPDGRRIVFVHSATGNPPDSIYTIGAEGGGLHRITHARQDESFPQYSPDGRWIVFSSFTASQVPALYLVRADGSHLHRLTPLRLRAATGDWSPDGQRIVSATNADVPHSVLFTIRPDGSGIRRITSGPTQRNDFFPAYSPDGRQIVFDRILTEQANPDLWVINADGSHPHDITNTPNVVEFAPDWGTFREAPGTQEPVTQPTPAPSAGTAYPARAMLVK
ncbi:MAG TPA: hypothetical protein VE777_05630 [Gaiellales bacterium]|jgi:TolB protein|nr:hypothetical protein [Gaiellales bacterium]